jgi:hypothetical protein
VKGGALPGDAPGWVYEDKVWAASVYLLHTALAGPARRSVFRFVDYGARRLDWDGLRLLKADLAEADRFVLDVAHALWGGSEIYCAFAPLVELLDASQRRCVFDAISIAAGDITIADLS